jgi:uroporphyrinogen decarboxylase
MRKYYLPWHKKYAKAAHDAGRLYILHSCGQITELMDDLIGDVQIDAKHSFQDNAVPILESKRLYGNRVALIGGVDVDVLVTSDAQELRKYVRLILEKCSKGGRFAIGSGNSIASYVPLENYLVLVDESLKWNRQFQ